MHVGEGATGRAGPTIFLAIKSMDCHCRRIRRILSYIEACETFEHVLAVIAAYIFFSPGRNGGFSAQF